MDKIPDKVKNALIEFIANIPVVKFSDDWQAIQIAISMITSPSSFKKGVHVYLNSYDGAREPGCFDISEMSIKIWPHKIQLRRIHREYNSYSDTDINEVYRYIFPNKKYNEFDFDELMSDTSCLFNSNGLLTDSGPDGHYSVSSNFDIETNIKL